MSPKLPVISGADLIRALGKFGYVAVRQKGIAFGTLRRILRDATITVEELLSVL